MNMKTESTSVVWKRVLTLVVCVFFLLVGSATSKKPDNAENKCRQVEYDVQRLEVRRDELQATVDELEQRCKELENRISEKENATGD